MEQIFVQIASYRDAELLPTLRDLFSKSSGKYEIIVGLVWQKDDSETIQEFENDNRVKIISCDWKDSKGLGWARNLAQSMYNNEDYTLQLDSHHRFIENWDVVLVDMYIKQQNLSKKLILTSYSTPYDPYNQSQHLNPNPCIITPLDFKISGTIFLQPKYIHNYQNLKEPLRARFVSGHYFFTTGQHCMEYKYDPNIYFAGDEISLTVRSYTLGYDLYHPHISIVYHHYIRNDKPKHWSDHTVKASQDGIVEQTWFSRDQYSKQRIRRLLGEQNNIDLGIYGLGSERSIHDYEKYAGIDFAKKRIQNSAIQGIEPPVKFDNEKEYNENFSKISTIKINNWEKDKYILYSDNISYFIFEAIALHGSAIYKERMDKNLLNFDTIEKEINADNTAMAYILSAFDKNNKILYKTQKDLKSNISWF